MYTLTAFIHDDFIRSFLWFNSPSIVLGVILLSMVQVTSQEPLPPWYI